MEITKTPNASTNGYYVVTITADYNDGDYITSYNEYEPDRFTEDIAPLLKELLDKAIGYQTLDKYLDSNSMDVDEFCEELGIVDLYFAGVDGLPHTITSANDIKIIYFAPDGTSYKVTLT